MAKTLERGLGLLLLTLLGACSNMVQQPAPVEPAQGPVARRGPVTAPGVPTPAQGAQTTPYKAPAAIRADKMETGAQGKTHVVQPGENLFRISLNHGLKTKQVAEWNNIPPDYQVKAGQVLRLSPPDTTAARHTDAATSPTVPPPVAEGSGTTKTWPRALKRPYSDEAQRTIARDSEGRNTESPRAATTAPRDASAPAARIGTRPAASAPAADASAPATADNANLGWIWPTEGKVLRGFSDSNKGLDIGGRAGQPVKAAADGKVVYSGSNLRGYGKFIIIKHDKAFLSVYAHNNQLLVKEGQTVKKGQKIAEMGSTDADQVKLHFEIRRFGKPVDPMQYLESKP